MNKKSGMTKCEVVVELAMAVLAIIAAYMSGWTIGVNDGIRQVKVDAVDIGVARWVVEDSEGAVAFRWLVDIPLKESDEDI